MTDASHLSSPQAPGDSTEKTRPARARQSPSLPGSLDPQRDKLRFCIGACQSDRPQAGGVETSPGRFRCATCWAVFRARMKLR